MENEQKIVTYVDPPKGMQYGFPKILPDPMPEDIRQWVIENGYPESELVKFGENFVIRTWQYFEVEDPVGTFGPYCLESL